MVVYNIICMEDFDVCCLVAVLQSLLGTTPKCVYVLHFMCFCVFSVFSYQLVCSVGKLWVASAYCYIPT
jgi:hypothetical protein